MSLAERFSRLEQVVIDAAAHRSEDRFNEAVVIIDEAVKLIPSRIGITRSLYEQYCKPAASLFGCRAYCKARLNNLDGALQDARSALEYKPEDASLKLLLAHLLYCKCEITMSKKLCEEVLTGCKSSSGEDYDDECDTDRESSDLRRRAALLLKRCEVDESYSSQTKDKQVLSLDGFLCDRDAFAKAWDPVAQSACEICGGVVASTNPSESGLVKHNDESLQRAWGSLFSETKVTSISGGGGAFHERMLTHLPVTFATLSVLRNNGVISTSIFAEVLSFQLLCMSDTSADVLAVTNAFFEASARKVLFASLEESAEISSSVLGYVQRRVSSSTNRSVMMELSRIRGWYSNAECFLKENGFRLNQVRGSSSSIMSSAAAHAQSRNRVPPPLDVAIAVFPLFTAMFCMHAGEAVQHFHSTQLRRSSTATDHMTDSNSTNPSDVSATADEHSNSSAMPCASTSTNEVHEDSDVFSFPTKGSGSDSVHQFAVVCAPIVISVFKKRSSTDSREFAKQLLNTFCPKEIHGLFRKHLEPLLIV